MATQAMELDPDAFWRMVTQENLKVGVASGGYIYTGKRGKNGWEVYKTRAGDVWNGLPLKVGTISNPAPGAALSFTVPVGKRYILYSVAGTFTTSAAAANRHLYIAYTDGTNTLARYIDATAQTASLAIAFTIAAGATAFHDNTLLRTSIPLPANGVELSAGYVVTVTALALDAADDFTAAYYTYKELSA